jgi:hypothetical protein
VSESGSLEVKSNEMRRLMKCANSCEMTCLTVSNPQIFHGRLGRSKNLLMIKTEKDRTPKDT